MKIYTRTGDGGETGLLGGHRVPKDQVRVAAYGDVDELSAALGVARATPPVELADELLASVQRDLFAIGGQLAAPEPAKVQKALARAEIGPARVAALEAAVDEAERDLPPLAAFILPGGCPKAAALHLARTVCRRAERSVVRLARADEVPEVVLAYLNRLSDLLFVLARAANHRAGHPEIVW